MNWMAFVIGLILIGIGIAIPSVGITDILPNTQSIIAFMSLFAGAICLALAGGKE
ncbi:hypothetical protein LCGC14_0417080 [marine sediment metagenome]|uniref:Uncharacterized protein n=1 Tax=marine sediment metagenome TaxID=412755 RepID=A0A0F9SY63_9ZZZZ